jgi:hypothetical protein
VLNSIRSLATQSIAVTMAQWTGPELHVQTVDWTLTKNEDSVNALADAIERRSGNCSAAAKLAERAEQHAGDTSPTGWVEQGNHSGSKLVYYTQRTRDL